MLSQFGTILISIGPHWKSMEWRRLSKNTICNDMQYSYWSRLTMYHLKGVWLVHRSVRVMGKHWWLALGARQDRVMINTYMQRSDSPLIACYLLQLKTRRNKFRCPPQALLTCYTHVNLFFCENFEVIMNWGQIYLPQRIILITASFCQWIQKFASRKSCGSKFCIIQFQTKVYSDGTTGNLYTSQIQLQLSKRKKWAEPL